MNPLTPLHSYSPKEATALLSNLWRFYPHTFASRISKGKWLPYPYLVHISDRIARGIAKGRARFIIELPPRHGKSELVSRYLPTWFLDNEPEKNVILCSYEADFAAHWGRSVRNLIEEHSDIRVKLRTDSTAAHRFNTTKNGSMVTAGVGGPITGRGGHLMVIDDPVKNAQEAMSEVKRKTAIEWFQSTFYTRLEPQGSIIVLQTRWHQDDLAGWLQKEHSDKWEVIRMPALAEANDPLGRSEGEPLCAERYTKSDLEKIKLALGTRWWSALYQQRPSPDEGSIIKRHWLRFWKELPGDVEQMGQFWDLTFKKGADTDYVVGQVWARKGANRYLVDQIRDRMDFPATVQAIRTLSAKWPQTLEKVIEDKANGPAVISSLREQIQGLIPFEPKGDKSTRLHAISPAFEAGNVYLPDPSIAPWINDYIEELVGFPHMSHDDQVDASTMALLRWNESDQPRIWLL